MWLVACSVLVFQPGRAVPVHLDQGCLAPPRSWRQEPSSQAGGRLPQGIRRALWATALVLAVSIAFSANPLASFLGRWPRFEGALVIALYFAVFALGAKVLGGPDGPEIGPPSAPRITPAVVIVGVISAFEAAGLRPLGGAADLRPGPPWATRQIRESSVFWRPPCWRSRPCVAGTWPARIGLAAAVLTTVLSGSRAAILGLAAVVLVLAASLR